ncbi:MAG TPA: hypothetical protein VNY36_03890 [Bacteroidia bacterium]|jgi:hypothetical protein|nr:hypothetical protein [Bacteroidia bacterium]
MIRKTIINLFSFSLTAALLSSCGSSNNVVSSLGKRKYVKGFYINLPATNERVDVISSKAVKNTTEIKKVSKPEFVPVAKTNNVVIEKITKTETSTVYTQMVKLIPVYENRNKPTVMVLKELKPDNDKQISDSAEDEKKEKQLNRVLGIVGFTAAIAGAIFLLIPNFIIAAIGILVGLILSAIGIKRGSSSLFAFFGFVISAIGAIILLDIFIVANQ